MDTWASTLEPSFLRAVWMCLWLCAACLQAVLQFKWDTYAASCKASPSVLFHLQLV
jgi:hypothetical protein